MVGTVVVPNFQEVAPGLYVDLGKVTHFTLLPEAPVKHLGGVATSTAWWIKLWCNDHMICELKGETKDELLSAVGLGKQSGIIQPGAGGLFR